MKKKLVFAFIVTGLLLPQVLWAQVMYSNDERFENASSNQQTGFDTFMLGDIVVSADADAPLQVSIVSVMTEEEIRATNAKTLGSALMYIPGVVMDDLGFKSSASITVNGLSGRNILVLVDGVPFYETSYRTLDLHQIPTAVISRIEVIKGNASVLYGPNAMGGMINVITKRGGTEPQVSAYAEVGDYNTYNLGASVGGSYNIFNGWLSVDHRQSDGWKMSGDFDPRVGYLYHGSNRYYYGTFENGGKRDNSDSETTSVWARLGVEPWKNSEYYVSLHYVTKEGGGPPGVDSMNFQYYPDTRDRFTWASRWDLYEELGMDITGKQQIFEDFTLTGKLFYHQHEDRLASYDWWDAYNGYNQGRNGTYDPGNINNPTDYGDLDLWAKEVAVSVYEDYMFGGQVIADWKIDDIHTVRASAQWREDEHKQKGDKTFKFDSATSETGSVGFEYQLNLFDRHLGIIAGISYDWFEVTSARTADYDATGGYVFKGWKHPERGGQKDAWNPMIGANFIFPDSAGFMAGTEIYGSIAKKTVFPTLREMVTTSTSNPGLEPQESINYVVGVQRNFFENKLSLGASGFYYDISDWITSDQNRWTSNGRSIYVNFGDINIWGFQVEAAFKPTENVTLTANYTYNDAENKSEQRGSNKVTGIFKHKVGLGAKWYIPEIGLRLDGRAYYVGNSYSQLPTFSNPTQATQTTGSYFIVGLTATKYLFDDHLEIYGAIDNLFDVDYGNNYPGRGRSFILGTRVSF